MTLEASTSNERHTWRMRVLFATWWSYAGLYFCRKAFYALKADLGVELGWSESNLGLLGASYLIAYACGQFLASWCVTQVRARTLLMIGIGVSLSTNIVFASVESFPIFLGAMILNGLAQATGWPSLMGILSQWTAKNERGTILGIWSTCYQLGGVMATAWAGYWLHNAGWRAAFLAASLVLVVVLLIDLLLLKESPEQLGFSSYDLQSTHQTLNVPTLEKSYARVRVPEKLSTKVWTSVFLLGLFYFGIKFLRYALWSWTPFILKTSYGLEGDDASYLSTLFDLCGFTGVLFAGFVSDRFLKSDRLGLSWAMVVGLLGSALCAYALAGASVTTFAILLGCLGFFLFGPDSLMTGAAILDLGGAQHAARIAGLVNGMGSLGAVLQEFLIPWMKALWGEESVFLLLLLAAALAFCMLSLWLVLRRKGYTD